VLILSVFETISNRGTIRRYLDQPISQENLIKIIEAARLSQSAANRQPWQFIIVTDVSMKKNLSKASRNQESVSTAAAVIVYLANPTEAAKVGPFEGFLIDGSIAIENMVLTSWEFGIGSCWIGAYDEKTVKELLGIPETLRVVSLLTLGYPNEKPKAKNRKILTDILHYERYGHKEP
jgi:nitroreductase